MLASRRVGKKHIADVRRGGGRTPEHLAVCFCLTELECGRDSVPAHPGAMETGRVVLTRSGPICSGLHLRALRGHTIHIFRRLGLGLIFLTCFAELLEGPSRVRPRRSQAREDAPLFRYLAGVLHLGSAGVMKSAASRLSAQNVRGKPGRLHCLVREPFRRRQVRRTGSDNLGRNPPAYNIHAAPLLVFCSNELPVGAAVEEP